MQQGLAILKANTEVESEEHMREQGECRKLRYSILLWPSRTCAATSMRFRTDTAIAAAVFLEAVVHRDYS